MILLRSDFLNIEEFEKRSSYVDSNSSKKLPDYASCVYFLLDCDNRPIYIGKALNPKIRVTQHLKGTSNKKEFKSIIDKAFIILTRDGTGLEKFLIRKIKPKLNKHLHNNYISVDKNLSYQNWFNYISKKINV